MTDRSPAWYIFSTSGDDPISDSEQQRQAVPRTGGFRCLAGTVCQREGEEKNRCEPQKHEAATGYASPDEYLSLRI